MQRLNLNDKIPASTYVGNAFYLMFHFHIAYYVAIYVIICYWYLDEIPFSRYMVKSTNLITLTLINCNDFGILTLLLIENVLVRVINSQ